MEAEMMLSVLTELSPTAALIVFFGYLIRYTIPKMLTEMHETANQFALALQKQRDDFRQEMHDARASFREDLDKIGRFLHGKGKKEL